MQTPMAKKTPLYTSHLQAGAKLVDFAGWDMPLHYGSQIQEHHAVRQSAGVFDVSHMTILDFSGPDVDRYLQSVLANDIGRLTLGKALYTCMLDPHGGIIDDLIVYKMAENTYRLVTNSATHDKDIAWFNEHMASFQVEMVERRDLAMLAVQGPLVQQKLSAFIPPLFQTEIADLPVFHMKIYDQLFVARTGYTGEDGYELILPAEQAETIWQRMLAADIQPCGLGARDTLRLEAGLNLYGADMDESVSPLESNLTWSVAFSPLERDFIGRAALLKQIAHGIERKLVGLVLEGPGVLRNHQKVIIPTIGSGEITSGSFSPSLNKGIAFARVPVEIGEECVVEMRSKSVYAQVVKLPFIKRGKQTFLEKRKNGAVT